MLSMKLHVAFLLAAMVEAQTPPLFIPDVNVPLLAYSSPSNISLQPPGKLAAPSEVANAPSVYLPSGYTNDIPYIGIQVDGAINALHWIQPNLVAKADGNMTIDASVQGASKVECPYLEPEPPADPHDYVILLYKQPNNWTVPEQYAKINPPSNIPDRLNFSLPNFMASSGLGAPIAATYFRAMNGTAQQSSYAVTATTYGVVVPATDTPVTASASRTNSAPVATFTGGAASAAVSMVELAAVAAVGWLGFL